MYTRHMVPGVDDGAADLEESLAMLKMRHEDGVIVKITSYTALSAADVWKHRQRVH